jgi:putative MATE family efflux protein
VRRSPHDREILRLALPALGALAAEPLYLLADTAIVGHLGTPQLAALALAATVLNAVVWVCNFLTYGTTARVARLHGAGQEEAAGAVAAQALWLAVAIGVAVAGLVAALAPVAIGILGGGGHVADLATRYLRIAALGLPCALIALAGQGWLRGVSDLRSPLVVVVVANLVNVALELLFVYGFGWGLDGSALGTVVAQLGMGAAFAVLLLRPPALTRRPVWSLMRPLTRLGGGIMVRTAALLAAFTVASAVLARVGPDALGAHQVAFQLYTFLSLVLDAIAIAGQVMVGRTLGAGDAGQAHAAGRRMIEWSFAAGCVFALALLALRGPLPHAFTGDAAVIGKLHDLWPLFVAMQPIGGIVFALDGILIGAGDTRYLATTMVIAALAFVPVALAALHFSWGVIGVWSGLDLLLVVRAATNGARFAGRRWALVGAEA